MKKLLDYLGYAVVGMLAIFGIVPEDVAIWLARIVAPFTDAEFVHRLAYGALVLVFWYLEWAFWKWLCRPTLPMQDAARKAYEWFRGKPLGNAADQLARGQSWSVLEVFGIELQTYLIYGKHPPSDKLEPISQEAQNESYIVVDDKSAKLDRLDLSGTIFTDITIRPIDLWRYRLSRRGHSLLHGVSHRPRPKPPAPPKSLLLLRVGDGGRFNMTKSKYIYGVERTLSVLIENTGATTLTRCQMLLVDVQPTTGYSPPWTILDDFDLVPGDSRFIPLCGFDRPGAIDRGEAGARRAWSPHAQTQGDCR